MQKTDFNEYYKEKMAMFDSLSDKEIIDIFNNQVGNTGTGSAKMNYLRVIREQLIKRDIDFSEIGDEAKISYKNKVVLENKIIKVL